MPERPNPGRRKHPVGRLIQGGVYKSRYAVGGERDGGTEGRRDGGDNKNNNNGGEGSGRLEVPWGGTSGKTGVRYAELHCRTNFSFLRGASHADELAERAAELGHHALGITDRNTLAGVVRMHCAAKAAGIRTLIGAEIVPVDGLPMLLYAVDRAGYGRLSRLITRGRLRCRKGECEIASDDVAELAEGLIGIVLPREQQRDQGTIRHGGTKARRHEGKGDKGGRERGKQQQQKQQHNDPSPERERRVLHGERRIRETRRSRSGLGFLDEHSAEEVGRWREVFGDRLFVAAEVHGGTNDARHLAHVAEVCRRTGAPMVAANDVHYHETQRRFLQDILVCIREHCTIHDAGRRLFANGERYLKSPEQMARLFAEYPEAIARTIEIADRCTFDLDELRYEYPEELCPADQTPIQFLSELTWRGARERFGEVIPEKVRRLVEHELRLIEELSYEPYFLTVWDLVRFARSRGILCQGRGSAANSAVCYCLGVTSVDPDRIDLLFERFVSKERNEPPDIDIDFEHERREEVFQYIYKKYGREHAGIAAEVITYRSRSAVRDVGKALGLSLDRVDLLAKKLEWWGNSPLPEDRVEEAGLDPKDRTVRMLGGLVRQIVGFPRHLSQHVGGFVMTRSPLCEMVPIENGAMPDRTFIEWDKDDIDALGILKVDCLALGMMTALQKCFALLRDQGIEGSRDQGTTVTTTKTTNSERGFGDGEDWDVSGSGGKAESDRDDQGGLSDDATDAERGEVRLDFADAAVGGLGSEQHRRRQRASSDRRVHSIPVNCSRIAGRVGNATHHRERTRHASGSGRLARKPSGGPPNTPKPHQSSKNEESRQIECKLITASSTSSRGHVRSALAPLDPLIPRSLDPFVPSCLRAFVPSCLTDLPPEDPVVYDMICQADTVGVFQIESRAQMSMLPRLRPRNFYDLVIEVAIVRPGPIQGGMVHPYLRRRNGEEAVTFPNKAIAEVLRKTLGVPLFQEQAMRLAVVAAGFTPGEADQLRRAMGAWRRNGRIEEFRVKLIEGMKSNGLSEEFAQRCFEQICGFGEYGFPESHAASFALLVYASAWLKRYYPAAFCAALINSQPMGFYAPAQLVRDAREHGVEVRGVDVNWSGYDCSLERGTKARRHAGTKGNKNNNTMIRARSASDGFCKTNVNSKKPVAGALGVPSPIARQASTRTTRDLSIVDASSLGASTAPGSEGKEKTKRYEIGEDDPSSWGDGGPALRLGMRLVKGVSREKVAGIEEARRGGAFRSVAELVRRSGVSRGTLARLAAADAFRSMGLDRRQAVWQALAVEDRELPLLAEQEIEDDKPKLRPVSLSEQVVSDYDTVGLSLTAHPMSLLREELDRVGVMRAERLKRMAQGQPVRVAGLVLVRQRPATASGVVFFTLEDETGIANLIVRPRVYERCRRSARGATALVADGRVERQGEVIHVQVSHLREIGEAMAQLRVRSRDFH